MEDLVQRDRPVDAVDELDLVVVLHAGADAREFVPDLDAVVAQEVGRADARELEQVRRADRAGGEDHLGAGGSEGQPVAFEEFDADGALALKHDLLGVRLGEE